MKHTLTISGYLFLIVLLTAGCKSPRSSSSQGEKQAVDYVNPYMGNISHLLVPTFPTVHLPNSMLRVIPKRSDFTDVYLDGLPLILTSHRGTSAFSLSPVQGNADKFHPVMELSYDQETLTPYSYSVYLDDQYVQVEFGLAPQAAAYELAYEGKEPAYLILNSRVGTMNWDGKALSGYQELGNDTRVFIYLVPDQSPTRVSTLQKQVFVDGHQAEGRDACLVLHFGKGPKILRIHYGVSFIDVEQARLNLERDISGKSVLELQKKGREIWNKALGKIRIQGGTPDERTVFYTSLYRCYERPVCISEDGRYFSAFDGQVHEDQGRPFYTDDWIWDSYRAQHPLRILLDPVQEEDILQSFVRMAEQREHFWMPTFPMVTGDGCAMNSNHGVASVLDAYRKGLQNFDLENAYRASRGAITEKTLAPWSCMPAGELDDFYKQHGYFPALGEGEEEHIPEVHSFESRQPVAVTLGTSYDHWCLAQLASELGIAEDAEQFMDASFNYRNLFHPVTRFFHPKDADGNFIEPFDYRFSGGMGARAYYDENNGWIYRWDVPHNIADLIDLMGGKEAFADELDAMFSEPLGRSKYAFYAQLPDHTGNVGQFSMANEPSLHIPYLYNYAGQAWKTQKTIRKLLLEWFRNDLMGVPGDEDGGGMSAFVVFSQIGFYPVTPGDPVYTIGSPVFEQISLDLGMGRVFEIEAKKASPENKYIQSATLNGKALDTPWFSHQDLIQGGSLVLEMGPKASLTWGNRVITAE
jgi:predicted alpha-1,2-mannosidase